MIKGQFDKLEGSGKPLSHAQSQNPYVDFTQHKINKILLENGFTPEWITLKKEIREDINNLVDILTEYRSYLGEIPLNSDDMNEWSTVVSRQENREIQINKKINKYNLIVPILDQQMCRIQLKRIADKVLNSKPFGVKQVPKTKATVKYDENSNKSLLSSFFWWT